MFCVPRALANSQSLKWMVKSYRLISSGKFLTSNVTSFGNIPSKGQKPKFIGYGEKEICLLYPIDARTPLPGNTGVPSSDQLGTRRRLSKNAKKHQWNYVQMPDDRQRNALAQLAYAAAESILQSPIMLECKAYECPQLLKQDFADLLPKLNIQTENLTVLVISQKTENDMSQWSETTEAERSFLHENFVVAAQVICSALKNCGYFADFVDPSTGRTFSDSSIVNDTMFETDRRYSNFGFIIEDLGCCKVISHPIWGKHAVIGAIFTNASLCSSEINGILSQQAVNDIA